jgi:phospholipase C
MKLAFRSSLLLLFGTLLAQAQISSFKHVIVIVQENRTIFSKVCAVLPLVQANRAAQPQMQPSTTFKPATG